MTPEKLLGTFSIFVRKMLVLVKNQFRTQKIEIELAQNLPVPTFCVDDKKIDPVEIMPLKQSIDPQAGDLLGYDAICRCPKLRGGPAHGFAIERRQLVKPKRITAHRIQTINHSGSIGFPDGRLLQSDRRIFGVALRKLRE